MAIGTSNIDPTDIDPTDIDTSNIDPNLDPSVYTDELINQMSVNDPSLFLQTLNAIPCCDQVQKEQANPLKAKMDRMVLILNDMLVADPIVGIMASTKFPCSVELGNNSRALIDNDATGYYATLLSILNGFVSYVENNTLHLIVFDREFKTQQEPYYDMGQDQGE